MPYYAEPVALSGGPDGVRTRDHRIKSPTLYLTELQAQSSNLGSSSDRHGVIIRFGRRLSHALRPLQIYTLQIASLRSVLFGKNRTFVLGDSCIG